MPLLGPAADADVSLSQRNRGSATGRIERRLCLQGFLQSSTVKAALNQTGSVLAAIQILKKICDHPALLSKRALKAVRMPRSAPEQRARRAAAKAAKAKAAKAQASRRPVLPPPPQRKAAVLDDSDSDDFSDTGSCRRRRADGSLTAGGFEVRVDGVLQPDADAAFSAAVVADGPAGLEDDDVIVVEDNGVVVVEDDGGTSGSSSDSDSMSDFIEHDSDGDDSDDGSSSSWEDSSDDGEESDDAPVEWVGEASAEPLLKKLEGKMRVGDSCKTVGPTPAAVCFAALLWRAVVGRSAPPRSLCGMTP